MIVRTMSKVLIAVTAGLATATAVSAIHDHKVKKAALADGAEVEETEAVEEESAEDAE